MPPLLLLPGIGGFPYPAAQAQFSDYAITHYPNALFFQRSLVDDRMVPFWSDQILSGYPFYADPLSGLHYPPGWLALAFPLPLGLNLTALLHVLWGGLGMALFLRRSGLGARPALAGALAFQGMPKLWAHYGAGHLTLLYAFAWLPWLLWAAASPPSGGTSRVVRPALFLAVLTLADPRAAAYGGLLWLGYEFGHRQSWRKTLAYVAAQTGLAALLAAPLLLPLLGFASRSTRALMTAAEVLAFSLPPARLLGLLVPDFGGYAEWMLYPGAAVLTLALIALLAKSPDAGFWAGAAGLALLWSLGEALPYAEALAGLPGVSLLRVPPRALFVFGLALAALAAQGLDALLNGLGEREVRRVRLGLAGLAALSLGLAGAAWAATGAPTFNFLWSAALFGVLAGAALAALGGRLAAPRLALAVLLLLAVDLAAVDASLFAMRPAADALAEGREAAEWLAAQPGEFRVYSPSYSIPQQTAAYFGLRLADGVNPLQSADYAEFMDAASGVPRTGYSVTLPPFDGDPASANAAYTPDARLLGELNVRFVAAEFPLQAQGLSLARRFGSTYIYENAYASGVMATEREARGFPPDLAAGLAAALFGLAGLGMWPGGRRTP